MIKIQEILEMTTIYIYIQTITELNALYFQNIGHGILYKIKQEYSKFHYNISITAMAINKNMGSARSVTFCTFFFLFTKQIST